MALCHYPATSWPQLLHICKTVQTALCPERLHFTNKLWLHGSWLTLGSHTWTPTIFPQQPSTTDRWFIPECTKDVTLQIYHIYICIRVLYSKPGLRTYWTHQTRSWNSWRGGHPITVMAKGLLDLSPDHLVITSRGQHKKNPWLFQGYHFSSVPLLMLPVCPFGPASHSSTQPFAWN